MAFISSRFLWFLRVLDWPCSHTSEGSSPSALTQAHCTEVYGRVQLLAVSCMQPSSVGRAASKRNPALYNQPVVARKERIVKIGGMSLSGFAGLLVIAMVIVVLVLGAVALVKYIRKK